MNTPFGERLKALRAERGMSQKDLAAKLAVTPAYLSALENGQRGVPNRRFLHKICQIFAIIWDEADELAALAQASDPKPRIDVRGKSADHIRLANLLAGHVPALSEAEVTRWLKFLHQSQESEI